MCAIRTIIILITIELASCNSPNRNSVPQTVNSVTQATAGSVAWGLLDIDSVKHVLDSLKKIRSTDPAKKSLPPKTIPTWSTEGNPKFIVDDYPVTNKMLEAAQKSGAVWGEGDWFTNDTLQQTLVFELYTDYHRLVTYHFLNNDIPAGIIKRIYIGVRGEHEAEVKLNYLKGFLPHAMRISKLYFTTNKGFKLGDNKEKAIEAYGQPDSINQESGVERYEWHFIGDPGFYNDTIERLKGKRLAEGSFGHQTILFFRKGKLIGVIFHNEVP